MHQPTHGSPKPKICVSLPCTARRLGRLAFAADGNGARTAGYLLFYNLTNLVINLLLLAYFSTLYDKIYNLDETEDLNYLSDARSISLLKKSLYHIKESINSIENQEPIEIVEINIKEAWENLGEIIGETYKEELLDELFSRFCLGK